MTDEGNITDADKLAIEEARDLIRLYFTAPAWVELANRLDLAASRVRSAGEPAASTDPHPRWVPDDKSDRHPQTVGEWDWHQDERDADTSFKRLSVASDYDDPRAPDQMALVLRIDLIRVLGDYGFQRARVKTFLDERRQVTDLSWQELVEKDDRTSPAECPDMVLITKDELWSLLIKHFPSPSYADAIRDCLGAVEAVRVSPRWSGKQADWICGAVRFEIEALTPGSPQ